MGLESKEFYDGTGLLSEVKRYKTPRETLGFLHRHFKDIENLFAIGTGPRLLTISSALPKKLHAIDINQGSIDRAQQFISTWEDYRSEEPLKQEFDFLEKEDLEPKFDNCTFYLGKIPEDFPKKLEGK